jgi:hypothetical protein
VAAREKWTNSSAQKLLSDLRASIADSEVDWDEGVPEQWGRLIRWNGQGEREVAAIALIRAPLVFIEKPLRILIESLERVRPLIVVEVEGWETEMFAVDREILERHFKIDLSQSPVNFSSMSASDLYYALVIA